MTCTDVDWCDVARVTIDVLPDLALIEIFDFYAKKNRKGRGIKSR
jgi:hypothetical protein